MLSEEKSRMPLQKYWTGHLGKGFNVTIVKEKKIDILTNYMTSNNMNAKETEILEKNNR